MVNFKFFLENDEWKSGYYYFLPKLATIFNFESLYVNFNYLTLRYNYVKSWNPRFENKILLIYL